MVTITPKDLPLLDSIIEKDSAARHIAIRSLAAKSLSGIDEVRSSGEMWGSGIGAERSGDFVAIAKAGSKDGNYETYAYVKAGKPASIKLPSTPGAYEIRYIMHRGRRVLARTALTIE